MDVITQNNANEDDVDHLFAHLQEGLAEQYQTLFFDPLARKTVITLPSLSMDQEILEKITGIVHYEERLLCLLMLLRMPRTHLIYLSSMPIQEEIVDYYLHLLPGITGYHARKRLTLISCYDSSTRPLTQKILARPRVIEKIRNSIPNGSPAHIAGFNITRLEQELAIQLGAPIYGCSPHLCAYGTKSGSRKLFREAGLLFPEGFENLHNMKEVSLALQELKAENPGISRAMVKLNDGFSGDGNAIYAFANGTIPDEQALRESLQFVAADMHYDLFEQKMALMGGIAEVFIEGANKRSPSVQCRINPLHMVSVVSTHDQVLSGEWNQVYTGASFPADPAYASDIGYLGYQVGEKLAHLGIIGRFGVDFISVEQEDGWLHYATEINLRKGGTTHPYLMLQFLTDGEYDFPEGKFQMPNGQSRCYFATDGLQAEHYKGLTPQDLIDIAICHGLHYDATIQEGVMFHLIGALSEYGKLGVLCVGKTQERAVAYYQKTVAVLDAETRQGD